MKSPCQITFRNISHDETIETAIQDKVAKLDSRFENIITCRVVVEVPHRHHKHGNYYNVRIDISVPEKEIVVNRDPGDKVEAHKDFNVALRDAFDAASRQLENYVESRRPQ
jgi:ribosome-associated translation inhibitor RaiA